MTTAILRHLKHHLGTGELGSPILNGDTFFCRKRGVDKSHAGVLSCLQPLSQPGVRDRSWGMLLFLPVIVHDFQPLPYKMLDYLSFVGEIQQAAEHLWFSGGV